MRLFLKIQKYILVLFVIQLTSSCNPITFIAGIPPKGYNSSDLLLFFDKTEGGISKLIDINGYYNVYNSDDNQNNWISNRSGLIFFDDGTYSCLSWRENPPIYNNSRDIRLKEYLTDYEYRCLLFGRCFRWYKYDLCGGIYTIKNDTIITEEVSLDYADLIILRNAYKVIDNHTILQIYQEQQTKDTVDHIDYLRLSDTRFTYHFFPATDLPPSINMYNKCMKDHWEDKSKWEEYKSERRKYLKLKKK